MKTRRAGRAQFLRGTLGNGGDNLFVDARGVMRGGRDNFSPGRQARFETGGTTGFPALADLSSRGRLDLLLPFYSTTETRELPARIFSGDGRGDFDWAHPRAIDCLSSIAFCPVDLDGNGYPDLFICCHRDDLGHTVNSKLVRNGPGGLDPAGARHAHAARGDLPRPGPGQLPPAHLGHGRLRLSVTGHKKSARTPPRPRAFRWAVQDSNL